MLFHCFSWMPESVVTFPIDRCCSSSVLDLTKLFLNLRFWQLWGIQFFWTCFRISRIGSFSSIIARALSPRFVLSKTSMLWAMLETGGNLLSTEGSSMSWSFSLRSGSSKWPLEDDLAHYLFSDFRCLCLLICSTGSVSWLRSSENLETSTSSTSYST